MHNPIDIGSRLELFVDRYLVEAMSGTSFKLHNPQPAPPAQHTICGPYMTVIKEADRYRAYYRDYDPAYRGEKKDGNEGEVTLYAESRDGIEWSYPELGICEINGSKRNNAVLSNNRPYCHNFAPFLDANPAADEAARYKALAGTHVTSGIPGDGLQAFQSPDGLHWSPMREQAVLDHDGFAFDSQNVSFWSVAEGCYVCYFRTWKCSHGKLRSISRTTSPDYINWSEPVAMDPNLPGESLYTSQTHPYFRAPHIYIALPTRFHFARGSSTDILFMASRSGTCHFERLFAEAFIRPGLDPARWGNRANYAACGVVPTGPAEMSIYHAHSGQRYVLRTDGFISVNAGAQPGEMITQPLTFKGRQLLLNYSTSAAGSVAVEIQQPDGTPIPGFSADDALPLVGDAIEQAAAWRNDPKLSDLAGRPVRLRFLMSETDLYSIRFS